MRREYLCGTQEMPARLSLVTPQSFLSVSYPPSLRPSSYTPPKARQATHCALGLLSVDIHCFIITGRRLQGDKGKPAELLPGIFLGTFLRYWRFNFTPAFYGRHCSPTLLISKPSLSGIDEGELRRIQLLLSTANPCPSSSFVLWFVLRFYESRGSSLVYPEQVGSYHLQPKS